MPSPADWLSAGLSYWADTVQRRAGFIVFLAFALCAVALHYSATHFAIDTDPDEMLSRELPYRKKGAALAEVFPQYPNSMVILIDGPNKDLVDQAADALNAAIANRPELFARTFDPQGMQFFRENGLLFLDDEELTELIDRLAEAQPLLGTLSTQPNLPGLLDVLRRAVEETNKGNAPLEVDFVFNQVARVVEQQASGQPGSLSWQEIMRGRELDAEEKRRLLVIQPVLDYNSFEPAGRALDAIHKINKQLELPERFGTRVRVTGPTALETEELRSVKEGMALATGISILLVLGLLFWCFWAPGPVIATLATLLAGLLWSGALAFLIVGRLNLISVAFAVLFVGVSVDFGIHFALRFREALGGPTDVGGAVHEAMMGVGGSIILCAVAAAMGFFSFLPTNYLGLAELGAIAGTSMFVALFANLTLLPALLTLIPPPSQAQTKTHSTPRREFVRTHYRGIVTGAAIVAIGGIWLASGIRFDFDPLGLRDPNSESVRALLELAEDKRTTPYRIVELATDLTAAQTLAARVEALPEVDYTTTLASFIPKNQEDKLDTLYTASLFLLPSLSSSRDAVPASSADRRNSLEAFRAELSSMSVTVGAASDSTALKRLSQAFDDLEKVRGLDDEILARLEERLVATLPARLADLKTSLSASAITLEDLPATIRERWVAATGQARIEIIPSENLQNDPMALRRFVQAVQTLLPEAAGGAIDIVESGTVVVRSFLQATAISLLLVGAFVTFLLRRIRDVLLIFVPLILAAILTIAITVGLGLSFNFANVIVLPLLFGLGVASGVHLIMRERHETKGTDIFMTSTPRAVVFSALTTIGSFGSLGITGHPGTASMGILLTVSITMTLACTLGVLPALMEMFPIRSLPDEDY